MVRIDISNKALFVYGSLFLLIVFVGVAYAFGGNQPSVMGHSLGEINLPSCVAGEVLEFDGTNWVCGTAAGGGSGVEMVTGSYTGDGSYPRQITGLGVDLTSGIWKLEVYPKGGYPYGTYAIKTNEDTTRTAIINPGGGNSVYDYKTGYLTGTADGFEVGNAMSQSGTRLNNNGWGYTYIITKVN